METPCSFLGSCQRRAGLLGWRKTAGRFHRDEVHFLRTRSAEASASVVRRGAIAPLVFCAKRCTRSISKHTARESNRDRPTMPPPSALRKRRAPRAFLSPCRRIRKLSRLRRIRQGISLRPHAPARRRPIAPLPTHPPRAPARPSPF